MGADECAGQPKMRFFSMQDPNIKELAGIVCVPVKDVQMFLESCARGAPSEDMRTIVRKMIILWRQMAMGLPGPDSAVRNNPSRMRPQDN